MIIIVGAGLAGLTCAKRLAEAGQQILVLEMADQVGGRVRTDYHEESYRLDRGFQVLFSAYPAARRHLRLEDLKLRTFDPGAILIKKNRMYTISDPRRQPENLPVSLVNPLVSPLDKVRTLRLGVQLARTSVADIFAGKLSEHNDESTESYLQRYGFSQKFIDNFVRPFYGGIFLDRSLQTSARMFQFTFKMLATDAIVLPAEGIQRIPEQLAAALPAGSIRYRAQVRELLRTENRVTGVRLTTGESILADQVVVATNSQVAARMTGQKLPTTPVGAVCLYFAGDQQLYSQRKILLNTDPKGIINNAVLLTNIAPSYAPPHKHLLSVTVLGNPEEDDELLAHRCRVELGAWFPDHDLHHWQLLGIYRIPFAQFAQPAGIFDELPTNQTSTEGLFLAGEYTMSSSIQGAIHSGEHAATMLLQTRVPVTSR